MNSERRTTERPLEPVLCDFELMNLKHGIFDKVGCDLAGGTGETRTRVQVANATADGGMDCVDFSSRKVIAAMVYRAFPTTLYQNVTDPASSKTIQVPGLQVIAAYSIKAGLA